VFLKCTNAAKTWNPRNVQTGAYFLHLPGDLFSQFLLLSWEDTYVFPITPPGTRLQSKECVVRSTELSVIIINAKALQVGLQSCFSEALQLLILIELLF